MGLLNPWVLLGILLSVLSAGGAGAYLGYQYRDGQAAQEQLDVAVAVVDEARKNAAEDTKAAVAAARKAERHNARVREAKLKGDLDAARQNRPECVRDAASMRVLHDLIDAVNDSPPTAKRVLDGVRPTGAPGGRFGIRLEGLGKRSADAVWGLSPGARGVHGLGGAGR